jgi:hypothetical protein
MRPSATTHCASIAPNMSKRGTRNGAQLERFHDPPAPGGPAMTFFQPVHVVAFSRGRAEPVLGHSTEDAECPLQTGVLVRKPTGFLHARETSMPRLNLVDPATATGAAKPLLDEIKGAFGTAPNMFRAVANSPAALKSM